MPISLSDYFGTYTAKHKDVTVARYANAERLLRAVNRLMLLGVAEGVLFEYNPKTKSQISGEKNGGFRPQDCPIGAPQSSHKECLAVDLYDPVGKIDEWLQTSKEAKKIYEDLGLYFEHPSATIGWSHWQMRKPGSGRRFFLP